jgi:hypothetical protein
MTIRQQWTFVAIVVLILGGGLLAATRYLGDEIFPVTVGSKAPDFRAVTMDGAPVTKTIAEIRKFRDEYGLTFEILHDATGNIKRDYHTTGVPETFVIGRDGVIRKKVIAAADWDSPANRALFAQLLGIPESADGAGADTARVAPQVPVRP